MSIPKSKFYITTSIAYANASPHIGFAMEVCQADVLARYHRMKGDDVFLLSGTDENGSKIKKTALENKTEPQEFVDEISAKFQLLLDTLNISNNDFIRTTDQKRHWPVAQKIWQKLVEAGDIYKGHYEGYYCVGCEAYLTEKDLVDGKCPNHQKAPEKIKEENYFFRLSKYSKIIQKKIESGELEILPETRKNEILNVFKSGLRDISFSRPKKVLDWGVPVPNDDTQTMYVWCDALTNYISALGYENLPLSQRGLGGFKKSVNFQKFWPADIHIIGKDILRFHTAIWPAMLLSAGLPLPKKIFVHGFITFDGRKISKSTGNVIDPFEVIDKYGVDALRYYLLKEIPSGRDGDFSYERFEEVYKSDLQNGIGNLISRVLSMVEKDFNGNIPKFNEKYRNEVKVPKEISGYNSWKEEENNKKLDMGIVYDLRLNPTSISNNYRFFKLNLILEKIINFVSILDKYIQFYEPYKLVKTNKEKAACVLCNCLIGIEKIAWQLKPFMPETSDKIFKQLFADDNERNKELKKDLQEALFWIKLKPETKIKKGEILFPRL